MNSVNTTVIVLSLIGLLSSLALSAKTVEQTYIDSYLGRTDIPVPVEVVAPKSYSGVTGVVELQFSVDAKGRPYDITVENATDDILIAPAREAVLQWRFTTPANSTGSNAPKVRLPIRFVSPADRSIFGS